LKEIDMSEQFKPGDVVMLKSGGPSMTVASVNGEFAECVWFEKNRPFREHYPFIVLKKDEGPSFAFA